jgi:RNA polymerase sigma factor (sigma-70 family)
VTIPGDVLREYAPRVLGTLVRRFGNFDACEDAVQEALATAAEQWRSGVPDKPEAWLLTVARRALVDAWRSDQARARREQAVAAQDVPAGQVPAADDTLVLFFLCCHPVLTPASQLALMLRAVAGLTTREIAAAFQVPESSMAKRISRAKHQIRDAGGRFGLPAGADRPGVVLHALYLLFTEGHTASSGAELGRPDLAAEAIRLTRMLVAQTPGDCEAAGLLALLVLTDARRATRTDGAGLLVPLEEQDRSQWDRAAIGEGQAILARTLGTGPVGPYQLQAAIPALHDEAPSAGATDWPQILALYDVLARVAPGPAVLLSRAVAVGIVHGPTAGLAAVGALDPAQRMAAGHRVDAVRAHLLDRAGDPDAAREAYLRAARGTANLPEQRYLTLRAARLASSAN